MNDSWINVTSIEILNNYQPVTINTMMQQLNDIMMDKLLFIGFAAIVCGAWHMSKYSHKDDIQTAFITGFIDMAAFLSGVAAFGFYAVYRGWL